MDQDVQAKRQELFRVLAEIERKVSLLEAKGLSIALFDDSKINSALDDIKNTCKNESAKLEVDLQGKADQTSKDLNLKNGFEKYMKDENKKLTGYKENVSIYNNMSKKYVSEINVKKLKPLVGKKNITELFRYLFSILYNKPESEFDAKKFSKIALDEDADDFQMKLASFNTTKFHTRPEIVDQFKRVKDQDFPESETNQDLNNLLNWMDYIHEMYLAELEFKQQQQNLKANQSEFGERLLKISLSEEDNVRKRQAVQIYKNAQNQADIDRRLVEQKKTLIRSLPNKLDVDKDDFCKNIEKFRRDMFDMPNHL